MLESLKIKLEEIVIAINGGLKNFPVLMRGVVIFCLIAIIPGYFLLRFVSQSYWNLHYKSAILSARPSFQNPKAPSVSSVGIIDLGQGSYSAYAKVTNENFELSADNIGYRFDFKTASGATARTLTGKLFLLPSQAKLLVVPRFDSPDDVVSGVLTLDQPKWQKPFSIPKVDLTAIRPDAHSPIDTLPYTVEAAVRNDSPYQLRQMEAPIVAYDKSGKVIALSLRQEFTVNPGEVRKFPVVFPGINWITVDKVDVFPQTDVLDSGNLQLRQSPNSSGSDLRRPANNNF